MSSKTRGFHRNTSRYQGRPHTSAVNTVGMALRSKDTWGTKTEGQPYPPMGYKCIHLVALYFSPAVVGQEACREEGSLEESGKRL